MSKLPKILSFSGRKHSGKTELAKVCLNYNYQMINFADSLKNLICDSLEISREYLEEHKDTIINDKYDLSKNIKYIAHETNIDEEIVTTFLLNKFDSIRQILQILGTNLIRNYNPSWHINKVKEHIKKNPNTYYCIGDTRFLDEKQMIEELNGQCWFIIRPNMFEISNHNSEISLKWSDFGNNIIVNNTNKTTLINNWNDYLKDNSIRIHNINNDFDIDIYTFLEATEDYSYVVGLLTSYGYISSYNHNCTVNLYHPDKYLVEMYKVVLKSKDLLHFKIINNIKIYSFSCNNPFIIENLKLWGLNPQKKINEIPYLLKNNIEMLKYWIVGLIDGNGSVTLIDNKLKITISSSKEIIESLYTILSYGKIYNNYYLEFYDDDGIKFYHWLENAIAIGSKKWNILR